MALRVVGSIPIAHPIFSILSALVAQLDRASDFGSEGWGFDSLRAYHFLESQNFVLLSASEVNSAASLKLRDNAAFRVFSRRSTPRGARFCFFFEPQTNFYKIVIASEAKQSTVLGFSLGIVARCLPRSPNGLARNDMFLCHCERSEAINRF